MALFVASALAPIDAEDQQVAEEIAQHSASLPWEVIAVAPSWAMEPAMRPAGEVVAAEHKSEGTSRVKRRMAVVSGVIAGLAIPDFSVTGFSVSSHLYHAIKFASVASSVVG